jgi:ArsR family transcriptional regulator
MELTSRQTQELFAVLGDRIRLRLACCLLLARDGLAVAELVDALGVSQPNVSRHLKLMRSAGLAVERREGRWVYYALRNVNHPFFENIRCCVESVCCCADMQEDLQRLRRRLKLRRDGKCVIGFVRKRVPRGRGGKGGRP